MQEFIIEQSDTEIYTPSTGLALAGQLINKYTDMCHRLDLVSGKPRMSHADVVKSYIGQLCLGKSDFEAVTGARADLFFKAALAIKKVPSSETLRSNSR